VEFNMIAFAVGINAVAIVAAGLGYLTPAASAILHQVVSLAVIAGSISLLVEGRAIGGAQTWRDWRDVGVLRLRAVPATFGPPSRAFADRYRGPVARAALAGVALLW